MLKGHLLSHPLTDNNVFLNLKIDSGGWRRIPGRTDNRRITSENTGALVQIAAEVAEVPFSRDLGRPRRVVF